MFVNIRWIAFFVAFNLLVTTGISWWVSKESGNLDVDDLEDLLEELSEANPHFLVSLLNKAAQESTEIDEETLEKNVFENQETILKAGFKVKTYQASDQKTFVIFADLADAHSLAYLKKVKEALEKLHCSIRIIPVSMFGEKSSAQAKFVTAAALQNAEKAFQLALSYDTLDGAQNDMMKASKELGLDLDKLSKDMQAADQIIIQQTQLAEDLMIPGAPTMFLLTEDGARFLVPVEAQDLPALINPPKT
jgi:hypothetical protein